MRIAFYSPRASHLEQGIDRGGDTVFLHSLFDGLAARGHELKVISRFNVRDLWRGKVPIGRLFTEARALRREVARFQPDAWLVYDSSRTYPDLFGWWMRPKRYVLLAAHTWQAQGLAQPWRSLFALAHQRSLARADNVTADRPESARRLRARRVPAEKLSVLPPATMVWDGLPSREEARRMLGLPQDKTLVLCVSRLTEPTDTMQKTEAVLDLLSAATALPPSVVLLLVGDGPGRSLVEAKLTQLNLHDRVRMAGAVPDVKPYYAACDLFAYTLQRDRPWMSVLEAQASGLPVLAMRTGSGETTVDEGRTGLLADDLDDFRSKLVALAAAPDRCRDMGRAARDYIIKNHSIETRARQVEDLLQGKTPDV